MAHPRRDAALTPPRASCQSRGSGASISSAARRDAAPPARGRARCGSTTVGANDHHDCACAAQVVDAQAAAQRLPPRSSAAFGAAGPPNSVTLAPRAPTCRQTRTARSCASERPQRHDRRFAAAPCARWPARERCVRDGCVSASASAAAGPPARVAATCDRARARRASARRPGRRRAGRRSHAERGRRRATSFVPGARGTASRERRRERRRRAATSPIASDRDRRAVRPPPRRAAHACRRRASLPPTRSSAEPPMVARRPGRRWTEPRGLLRYLICMPEIAREMTSRWISEVPSKIV